jgi:transposase InsO family protein
MHQEGIVAKRRKKFVATTDSKHDDPIATNVLEREFDVELPNTAWGTDVTYVPTLQGWLLPARSGPTSGPPSSASGHGCQGMGSASRAIRARPG